MDEKISNDNKGVLLNIKSNYILKQIFNNLSEKKKLQIIKYNKNIQEKINKSIDDYKKYYYRTIIEIFPKQKEDKYNQDKNVDKNYFINIGEKEESFFHIYFNNELAETKRNYYNKEEKIYKIKVIIDYDIKSFKELFKDCQCIELINFIRFKRNDIINMSYMFYGCKSLQEVNFNGNFNSNNKINMNYMPYGNSFVNLNNFNANNNINTNYMPYGYPSMNLNNFNTNNNINTNYMPQYYPLVNYNNFNTNNKINMTYMPYYYPLVNYNNFNTNLNYNPNGNSLVNLDDFNTSNVTDMSYMFYGCKKIKKLYLNKFNTNNVTNMSYMFYHCNSLKKLNLDNFNTNNVIDMSYMFCKCWTLKKLNLENFNTNNVTNMSYMFSNCSSLKEIILNSFNVNDKTNIEGLFLFSNRELKNKIFSLNGNLKERIALENNN